MKYFITGATGFVCGRLPEMYSSESLRVQSGVTYLGDNGKAVRELGYHPRPLREGLNETLEWERTHS